MKKAIVAFKATTFAGALLAAPFVFADDIILHANFDEDPLGSPNPFPPSEPAGDFFTFEAGNYNVVADPLVEDNQFLDGIVPVTEARISAFVDASFGSASDADKYFEIAWTSSVGTGTSATIKLQNTSSTSVFVHYNGSSQLIEVSDADGNAIATSSPLSFSEDVFQDFLLRVNFATETFTLEVDGTVAVQDAPLIAGASKGITNLEFSFASDVEFNPGMPGGPTGGLPFGYFSLDEVYILRTEAPVLDEVIPASFEVKAHPLSYRAAHCFNRDIRFLVPVVIHGSPELDVTQIDIDSLALNGLSLKTIRGHALIHVRDLGGPGGHRDGYPDLFGYFAFNSDDWDTGDDSFYVLSGYLADGSLIAGTADRPAPRYPWLRRFFR